MQEAGGEQQEDSGKLDDDDDLIVLDSAPATRATLRQNLLRIAATERYVLMHAALVLKGTYCATFARGCRAKAKEGKQTIRLEDEEGMDEEEFPEGEV